MLYLKINMFEKLQIHTLSLSDGTMGLIFYQPCLLYTLFIHPNGLYTIFTFAISNSGLSKQVSQVKVLEEGSTSIDCKKAVQ